MAGIDWVLVFAFFAISAVIGLSVAKRSGTSSAEFFLGGRSMPWWLLGVSLVATTFSADTPNLVADIVRQNGVAGNWVWWAFLLTGMLTVFVYAKLWRRSNVMTDLEFYELRYSGKPAAFLRGFRAVYLGVFFNVLIMASVCLAAIKIGGVMLGLSPRQVILTASIVTVFYSAVGGYRGVVLTDCFQFIVAMVGSIGAAVAILGLPEVGGLDGLLTHQAVADKLDLLPDFSDTSSLIPLFVLPLAIQWWSVWYPGAEPGGGSYVVQRILSSKNEKHAMGATMFFNVAHYALRPWPWIVVALCSLIVFPDLAALRAAFPHVEASIVRHDLAYPAMLTFLPAGLLGIVIASLIAAFMSTISTHLNWGASYVVNDIFGRFISPSATERQQVQIGRIATVLLMLFAGTLALYLRDALQAFNIMLQVGAGTGLLFLLRWFWWRVNPYSEITAMVVSFLVAIVFQIVAPDLLPSHLQLAVGVGITTVSWVLVTFLTPASDPKVLRNFYRIVQPGGPGWSKVVKDARADHEDLEATKGAWEVPLGILCMALGCIAVYGALFATGYIIYGNYVPAVVLIVAAAIASVLLIRFWRKLRARGDHGRSLKLPS